MNKILIFDGDYRMYVEFVKTYKRNPNLCHVKWYHDDGSLSSTTHMISTHLFEEGDDTFIIPTDEEREEIETLIKIKNI